MSVAAEERITGTHGMKQLEIVMSLCTRARLQVLAEYALKCVELPGEFWEMGVYNGGSASLLGKIGREKALRLFDSFEGVSDPGDKDYPTQYVPDGPMWAREWRGDLKRALINIGRECIIHEGWIPETFKDVPKDAVCSLAHVDVDLYQPTKDSLEFILPRLADGGVIIVDDFDVARHPGVRVAIEELLPLWPKLKGKQETEAQVVLFMEK